MHSFAIRGPEHGIDDRPRIRLFPNWMRYRTSAELLLLLWLLGTLILTLVLLAKPGVDVMANLAMPLAVRIVGIPLFLLARPLWTRWQRPVKQDTGWLFLWHLGKYFVIGLPLLGYPIGYMETGKFIAAIHDLDANTECINDLKIQSIEQSWFATQPAVSWKLDSQGVGALLLAEYLQFCYFNLFTLAIVLPVLFYYLHRKPDVSIRRFSETHQGLLGDAAESGYGSITAQQRAKEADGPRLLGVAHPEYDTLVSCLLLSSFICWTFYMTYPVAGPLWCLPPKPKPKTMGYLFAWINLTLQGAGASHGTATPSSHCCGSVGLWVIVMVYRRRLAMGLTLIVPPLVFSTVYLHYHYAFDSIIGTVMGMILPFFALKLSPFLRSTLKLRSFLEIS